MQQLCNDLSWSYGRATLSVSLVPPAYYCDVSQVDLPNRPADSQVIAGQARNFVYADEASEVGTTLSSGNDDRNAEFDPLQLCKPRDPDFVQYSLPAKRIEASEACESCFRSSTRDSITDASVNECAWYM